MHGEGFRKLGFPVCALCCKTRRMTDSNVVIRKKRGRPRTGQDPVLSFRWGLDFKEAIDRWRALITPKHARSCALSHLPLSHEKPQRVPPLYCRARRRKPHFKGTYATT